MLAYWCLYDLFLELTTKDGVLLVGGRTIEVDLGVIVDEVEQALGALSTETRMVTRTLIQKDSIVYTDPEIIPAACAPVSL